VAEVPLLKELYAKYAPRGAVFLGVSMDEELSALDKMVAEKAIPWPQLCDGKSADGEVARAFRFGGNTPFFYLLGRDGRIAARFRFAEEAERHLEKALAVPAAPDAPR
jgi:peroxiredoxin